MPNQSCPFIAGSRIEDPALFVGRRGELRTIASRMTAAQPTSVNVVGERRIGKSSLLYHFFQTYDARVNEPQRYAVVYLDLQSASCATEGDFYREVARALKRAAAGNAALTQPLEVQLLGRRGFSEAVRVWKQAHVLPVLCLDEFEQLLDHQREFDDGFYDNLRALMNGNALMLVIASRRMLDEYRKGSELTSEFFNLGQSLHLGDFGPSEVEELLRLPAREGNGESPLLRAGEQDLAKNWAGNHPYLLQLAALKLCDAAGNGRSVAWAKAEFAREAGRLRSGRMRRRRWIKRLGWLTVIPFLGQVARGIGDTWENVAAWIFGAAVLIVVAISGIALISGVAGWPDVKQQIDRFLED
ncbi:MAG: AAA family ATPase [Cyanobacteria bacterium P01_A01_bin.135]